MAALLTFAPGVNPSFTFPLSDEWPADETPAIKPYIQVVPRTLRAVRRATLDYRGLTRTQLDYIQSFFHELKGGAGVFLWTPPDPVFTPSHRGPDLSQVTAGALGSRTYSVRFTWYDNATGQESLPSPASSLALASGKVLLVTVPIFPMGVPAIRVYAATIAGAEVLQAFSLLRTWQEPVSGLLTGTSAPPAANTLKPPIKWRLAGGVVPQKTAPNRYDLRLEFAEQHV